MNEGKDEVSIDFSYPNIARIFLLWAHFEGRDLDLRAKAISKTTYTTTHSNCLVVKKQYLISYVLFQSFEKMICLQGYYDL